MELHHVMQRPVQTVAPDTPVQQIHAFMQQQHLHHVAVLHDGVPIGAISDASLWRATPSSLPVLARYEWTPALDKLRAQDVMSACLRTLPLHASMRQAAQLLAAAPTECVLVLEAECLVGLVTLEDLLPALVSQLEAQQGPVRYEQIVVCVADRTMASPALRTAYALARQHQARLAVLQVLPSLGVALPADLEHISVEMALTYHEERKTTALAQLATCVPLCPDVAVECHVVEGEVWVAVVKIGAQLAADLIVMESSQRRWGGAKISRHQGQMVVRYAPCPVLLVEQE